ncbi:hypothetical protein TYRP_015605 [Tyrophagus putrescentiae]|nr:hypothetical protein TYRP_015605 [Tyrophagus putrescentiae]
MCSTLRTFTSRLLMPSAEGWSLARWFFTTLEANSSKSPSWSRILCVVSSAASTGSGIGPGAGEDSTLDRREERNS